MVPKKILTTRREVIRRFRVTRIAGSTFLVAIGFAVFGSMHEEPFSTDLVIDRAESQGAFQKTAAVINSSGELLFASEQWIQTQENLSYPITELSSQSGSIAPTLPRPNLASERLRDPRGSIAISFASSGVGEFGERFIPAIGESAATSNDLTESLSGDSIQRSRSSEGDSTELSQVFELAALGPIEAVSLAEDGSTTISILGQSFVSADGDAGISVGDYVFAGSVSGGVLDFLVPVGEEYILGVSDVRVLGAVEAVRPEIAQFSIGQASFDYSYLLGELPQFALSSGEYVEVAGNQAVRGGSILLGIHGSGIRTISLQGIHGSGIGSSFLQGIHGSGIGSSFLQGIHGSGIDSSFLQGIHGSGIGSSFLQGIHGSGIGSSFLQGIHGSGIAY